MLGQLQAEVNPYPVSQRNGNLTVLAWLVTILVSTFVDAAWVEISGAVPAWLPFARMGLLLSLSLGAFVSETLRPLRNFFIAMLAFFGFNLLRLYVDFTWPWLQALFGDTVFDARMQAEQIDKLAVSLAMIGLLLLLGYSRCQFFLTHGDLRAPIEPVPLLGFPKADPWPQFGLQWGLYIAIFLAVMQYLSLRPNTDAMLAVAPMLPSILFYAALNAFNEEVTYRSPMLATLEPVVGSKQALWLSAYFFGIGHYFGIPGGLIGGVLSIFMGWLLGKAMVETRGFFWSWWIHFLSDIVIFTFLAAGLMR